MKTILVGIFIALALFLVPGLFACEAMPDETYLRIHIRANSDEKSDQEIKLAVRDEMIEYLSPLLSPASSRREAEKIVLSHREELRNATDEFLTKCGFDYGCEVSVRTEYFDERSYGDLTLSEGYYRAVVVELGSGLGKNWWCVAFPPLCFTLDENYENAVYKSYLYEIVKKYLQKEGK